MQSTKEYLFEICTKEIPSVAQGTNSSPECSNHQNLRQIDTGFLSYDWTNKPPVKQRSQLYINTYDNVSE